jgi:hypothetical protein
MCSKAVALAREECNKYDLTAEPCFLICPRSRWFTISTSHIFAVLLSVLWVGLPKKSHHQVWTHMGPGFHP